MTKSLIKKSHKITRRQQHYAKDGQGLSKRLLLLMSITTGVVVANNYYNQPLLGLMAKDFGVSELQISSIPMLTQIGYAFGLFFIVPLGDKLKRKKLILADFAFIIIALVGMALSTTPFQLKLFSFLIGFTAVIAQLLVPMAAQLSTDDKRGSAIGTVMSGLLMGILASRTLSGYIGAHFGWQAIYYIAAGLIFLLFFCLVRLLPEINPDFKGTYPALLKSIITQFRTQPGLRLASFRGAFDFACFSVFWTTIVFLLEGAPFHMGSDVAGAMGLVGIAGAIVASYVGKLSDRGSKNKLIMMGILIVLLSWVVLGFSGKSMVGLIIGAFLLDWGVQSVHITNQAIIFQGNPTARNRINTVYMVWYFIGGSLGTLVGGAIWFYTGWLGTALSGVILSLMMLVLHIIGSRHLSGPVDA
jgi:predicted MFS family arabinose efflux permease